MLGLLLSDIGFAPSLNVYLKELAIGKMGDITIVNDGIGKIVKINIPVMIQPCTPHGVATFIIFRRKKHQLNNIRDNRHQYRDEATLWGIVCQLFLIH